MHIITSLELLRTLIAVFSATKQLRECMATDAWKAYFSVRESC